MGARWGYVRISCEFYIVFSRPIQKSLKATDLENAIPDNAAFDQGPNPAGVSLTGNLLVSLVWTMLEKSQMQFFLPLLLNSPESNF